MAAERIDRIEGREVGEQLARCVATMVYFQSDGGSRSGARFLAEQARSLLAWASQRNAVKNLTAFVLEPLEGELSGRYGPEVGRELHREFLRALHDANEG